MIDNIVALLVLCVIIPLGIWLRIKLLNTPDGERYLKQRMQGPFVPVHDSDETKDGK